MSQEDGVEIKFWRMPKRRWAFKGTFGYLDRPPVFSSLKGGETHRYVSFDRKNDENCFETETVEEFHGGPDSNVVFHLGMENLQRANQMCPKGFWI